MAGHSQSAVSSSKRPVAATRTSDRDANLERVAARVRRRVCEMIGAAGKGHIGGSLSCSDILVALYQGGVLHVDPRDQSAPDRDRFIFSKGHACEGLYAVLADFGFFPDEVLATYGAAGTILGGHIDRHVPGIEVSTGSLGHGLGIGAGLALAGRRLKHDYLTVVLLGDGECYEGSIWEAAMFAAHHQLSRLVAVVDRNGEITLDKTEDCNRLEPFAKKWESFGWETREVDGHSIPALLEAFSDLRERKSARPTVIIANTLKGRGVSFMETEVGWHHNVPKGDRLKQAMDELSLAEQGTEE